MGDVRRPKYCLHGTLFVMESFSQPAADPKARSLALEKWGDAMLAGHQVVPNILVQSHKQLKLDPLDVLIILNLNMHWWKADDLPYPKPASLAGRIGVTTRTIERRLQKLQKAGFIERVSAQSTRKGASKRYRLAGLVDQLGQLAKQAKASRRRSSSDGFEDSGEG